MVEVEIVNGVICVAWYDKYGCRHLNAMGVVVPAEEEARKEGDAK